MSNKVGRNDPCPCGSGKKYKRCHGNPVTPPATFSVHEGPLPEELQKVMEGERAAEMQRQQQQGLGNPIISEMFQGYRFVAVGNRLYHSKSWRTFHDFLNDYIKMVLGGGWGNEELKKPKSERHPILVWYETATRYMNQFIKEPGKVHAAPTTGAVAAYFGLAYNLYLLAHNVKVQEILIRRLKDRGQFYGAYYETFVTGTLIRAGFDIEFEDETDSTRSHCELTATFRKTGKKFSVEAKVRGANKVSADVGNQLYAALRKEALRTRVVFIEANVPIGADTQKVMATCREVLNSMRTREPKLTIEGQPAPPAYVIVTNNPHEYDLHGDVKTWAFAEGFKIPDFKLESAYFTLREALAAREKHLEMFSLMKSLAEHRSIPSTFDGDNPDLAFSGEKGRLIIGRRYALPDGKGGEVVGELQFAAVMESKKVAVCIHKLADGQQIMGEDPLSDEELAAYRGHPGTFFGVVKRGSRGGMKDPLEFYDNLLEMYMQTPKENLLRMMGVRGREEFEKLTQAELAGKYAECIATQVMTMSAAKENKAPADSAGKSGP
jgi:hypothetical protein